MDQQQQTSSGTSLSNYPPTQSSLHEYAGTNLMLHKLITASPKVIPPSADPQELRQQELQEGHQYESDSSETDSDLRRCPLSPRNDLNTKKNSRSDLSSFSGTNLRTHVGQLQTSSESSGTVKSMHHTSSQDPISGGGSAGPWGLEQEPLPGQDHDQYAADCQRPPSTKTIYRVSKYTLQKSQLPKHVAELLAEVKSYFVQPINMERQRPPIAKSTYNKSEERLLCT